MRRWSPVLVWVLSSGLLVLLASGVEYGAVVVAVYVALNVIGVAIGLTKQPPYSPRATTAILWCAAAQLPVMVMPFLDPELTDPRGDRRRRRERLYGSDPGRGESDR